MTSSHRRRRSEISAFILEDLKRFEGGYLIHIRASKTDQTSEGHDVPVLSEAAQALSAWLIRSGLREGHLFRVIRADDTLNDGLCGRTINGIVKTRARQAGLDPARAEYLLVREKVTPGTS